MHNTVYEFLFSLVFTIIIFIFLIYTFINILESLIVFKNNINNEKCNENDFIINDNLYINVIKEEYGFIRSELIKDRIYLIIGVALFEIIVCFFVKKNLLKFVGIGALFILLLILDIIRIVLVYIKSKRLVHMLCKIKCKYYDDKLLYTRFDICYYDEKIDEVIMKQVGMYSKDADYIGMGDYVYIIARECKKKYKPVGFLDYYLPHQEMNKEYIYKYILDRQAELKSYIDDKRLLKYYKKHPNEKPKRNHNEFFLFAEKYDFFGESRNKIEKMSEYEWQIFFDRKVKDNNLEEEFRKFYSDYWMQNK